MAAKLAEMVARAASVGGKNVFAIPSMPLSSGFADEQMAGFNLAWAMHRSKRVSEGDRVAVFEDSPAGLSTAIGLTAFGCRVELFLAQEVLLAARAHAVHRTEHPSLRHWPMRELSLTTKLPFLDWYENSLDQVVDMVTSQFGKLKVEAIHKTSTFEKFSEIAGGLFHVRTQEYFTDTAFAAIVLAPSTENERAEPNFPTAPYWAPDGLELDRDIGTYGQVVVSGNGDAGLSDALRLAHRNWARLSVDVATDLSGSPIAKHIADQEVRARQRSLPDILADAYRDAVGQLFNSGRYHHVADRLQRSLINNQSVYLVAPGSAPFSHKAMPILKLLVTHAIREGAVNFVSGRIERDQDRLHVGPYTFTQGETQVIIRHGGISTLRRWLAEKEYNELIQRFSTLDLSEPLWGGNYPALKPDTPAQRFTDLAFMQHRAALARRAMLDHFDANLSGTNEGYVVQVKNETRSLPSHLFGVPLSVGAIREVDSLGSGSDALGRGILQDLDLLEADLAVLPPTEIGIGHNRPPDEIEASTYPPEAVTELAQLAQKTRKEMASPAPDPAKLTRIAGRYKRWGKAIGVWLARKADLAVDEAIKSAVTATVWSSIASALLSLAIKIVTFAKLLL